MELFHRILDFESAKVRKRLVELKLESQTRFRNIDASESSLQELKLKTGGDEVPVLVTDNGETLKGFQAINAFLSSKNS